MEELSYSLHLGNDKNKSKKARRTAKTNETNTTSFNNNAIQNQWALSKVDKHNLRKYDDDKENTFNVESGIPVIVSIPKSRSISAKTSIFMPTFLSFLFWAASHNDISNR